MDIILFWAFFSQLEQIRVVFNNAMKQPVI